jgi:hypothetical protein
MFQKRCSNEKNKNMNALYVPGLRAVDISLYFLTVEAYIIPNTQVLPHAWFLTTAMELQHAEKQ